MFEMENCSCQYNNGVDCFPGERHCEKCGWNPVVADKRLKQIVAELYAEAEAKKEDSEN